MEQIEPLAAFDGPSAGSPARLLQENLYDGRTRYSVERMRNGEWCYISGTLSHDREEAEKIYAAVIEGRYPVVSVEVLRESGAL